MPFSRVILRAFLAAFFFFPAFARAADAADPVSSSPPPQIAIGQVFRPEDENRLVEADGTVAFVGREGWRSYLELHTAAGSMQVSVTFGVGYLEDLLFKSQVRARGIYYPIHSSLDGKTIPSLSVSNLNDITILQLPEETWHRYPVGGIDMPGKENGSRKIVHLRGVVQSVKPGDFFLLTNETGQATVSSKKASAKMTGKEIEVLGAWTLSDSNLLFRGAFFREISVAGTAAALPTLTTVEQVRWLKPDDAKLHYPVKLRGVITWTTVYHNGEARAYLQDGTGGIRLVELESAEHAYRKLRVGNFCEVEGVTSSEDFSPHVLCSRLRVQGTGQLPEPLRPGWEELMNIGLDSQWVEVSGVVLSASRTNLVLAMNGGRIRCSLRYGGTNVPVGATMRVRGVVRVLYDLPYHYRINDMSILVPSLSFISMESPAPADPFSVPDMHVNALFAYNPSNPAFQRVKVTGQVVHVRNGICHVVDGTNGIRVVPIDKRVPRVGDVIEAVGFPDIDHPFNKPLLTLRDAVVRKTGQMPLPEALAVTSTNLPDRGLDSTLVHLKSRLLNINSYATEQVLELQEGPIVYLARLDAAAGQIPKLQPGSMLELTGVYAMSNGKSVPFELLLNSPGQVRVLELPAWWTAQRAILLVSGLVLAIVLGLVCIGMLRQQVGRRTLELSAANQSLKKEIAERERAENELVQTRTQHLIEQERTRIARDIHDELGCSLSEIRLLSEMTLLQNAGREDVPANIRRISAKALQTTRVLDEIVWAADPKNDTLESLLNYLFNFASEYFSLAGIRFRVEAPTTIPPYILTAQLRHQLYMALKETLANIVNHARATEVTIHLKIQNGAAYFIIEDNGCGFEPASPAEVGASGLDNMRKRFAEVGGEFALNSRPERGTRVEFTLPLS